MEGAFTEHPFLLHRRFTAVARRQPHAPAIVSPSGSITYGELDRRSDDVAARLRVLGAAPECCVAVKLERSIDCAVVVLGVLKAGAAFVPIDPEWPAERTALVLEDCRACVCAAHDGIVARTAAVSSQALSEATPESLAYVIYTSGSTGRPKGVLIEHRAICTHLDSITAVYRLTAQDRSLFFHSVAFDPSIEQLFAPLLVGGTVVMRGRDLWAADEFAAFVRANAVTVATLPVAYWLRLLREWEARGAVDALAPLRQVIVGGEAFPPAAVELWRRLGLTHIRLLNDYGPTECTITATVHELPAAPSPAEQRGRIPIGRPHGPVEVHLLDGELCLGGPTLARGYLGREDLTRERFIAHPARPEARLYRTGDLVRIHDDGTLDFLGRIDDQVKVRGHRVELGEVESVLGRMPGVAQAAAVVVDKGDGDRHLAAFIVPATGTTLDIAKLREDLTRQLPPAAVPSEFRTIATLPLTPNGKIDRKQLAGRVSPPATVRVTPEPGAEANLEDVVARTWESCLGNSLARDANFFEHGATSLTVCRVHQELQRALVRKFSVTLLFQFTTINTLAAALVPAAPAAMTTAIARARQQRAALARRRPNPSVR